MSHDETPWRMPPHEASKKLELLANGHLSLEDIPNGVLQQLWHETVRRQFAVGKEMIEEKIFREELARRDQQAREVRAALTEKDSQQLAKTARNLTIIAAVAAVVQAMAAAAALDGQHLDLFIAWIKWIVRIFTFWIFMGFGYEIVRAVRGFNDHFGPFEASNRAAEALLRILRIRR